MRNPGADTQDCGLTPEPLLRQPGGVEGTRPILSEVGPADGVAIAECPQIPDKDLNVSTAHLAAPSEANQRQHVVACIDQLFNVQTRATSPRRVEVAVEGAHFIGPMEDHGIYQASRKVDHEIRWKQMPGLRVLSAHHRVEVPDDLHVPFRHHPRSIRPPAEQGKALR